MFGVQKNVKYNAKRIVAGVTEGSVIESQLFIIHNNDIPKKQCQLYSSCGW